MNVASRLIKYFSAQNPPRSPAIHPSTPKKLHATWNLKRCPADNLRKKELQNMEIKTNMNQLLLAKLSLHNPHIFICLF
jgi:hypothetical protein